MDPEFDQYAERYDELLRDPLRDGFGGSGFFHLRKWLLLSEYLREKGLDPEQLAWLDVGCGRGELLRCGAAGWRRTAGCDPSQAMLDEARSLEVRRQEDGARLPFDDGEFDVVTAACVFHHLPLPARSAVAAEMKRVLRPGGVAVIFEHNPINPVTQLIVRRTEVDRDAKLLTAGRARRLFIEAGLTVEATRYYLFLPAMLFRRAQGVERMLSWLPLGGQCAVFARRRS